MNEGEWIVNEVPGGCIKIRWADDERYEIEVYGTNDKWEEKLVWSHLVNCIRPVLAMTDSW